MSTIPEPVRPAEPVYEDAEAPPDQAHVWRLDDRGKVDHFATEGGYHNGPGCQVCEYDFCEHCEPNGYDNLDCLRNQAEERNWRREDAHKKAMARYEAQMDYYRSIV